MIQYTKRLFFVCSFLLFVSSGPGIPTALASEDDPRVHELLKLHEHQKTIDQISNRYAQFGQFWLVDFTLNDLNAAVEVILNKNGQYQFDQLFAGIDQLTAMTLYIPVLMQDILSVVNSVKIKKLINQYEGMLQSVRSDISQIEQNSSDLPQKLKNYQFLAETLSYELSLLISQKEQLHDDMKLLGIYTLGYSAKLGTKISAALGYLNPAKVLPFVSLFITGVWIGNETSQYFELKAATLLLSAKKDAIRQAKEAIPESHQLAQDIMEFKARFIEQQLKNNGFSKKINYLSLGYAAGDMALVAKSILLIAGVKVGVLAATAIAATGIGAAVLGTTAVVALGGRYLYNSRHSFRYRWNKYVTDRKLEALAKQIRKNNCHLERGIPCDTLIQERNSLTTSLGELETFANDQTLAQQFFAMTVTKFRLFKSRISSIDGANDPALSTLVPYLTNYGEFPFLFEFQPIESIFRFITSEDFKSEPSLSL